MGLVNRKATPEEIEKMKVLAEQAMRDGAFGLSTGLFYVPGNFTPTEEVIELAKVVGRMGGNHISHMRDEASHVIDSVKETIRIGEEGGLPTQITHHKIIGQPNWGQSVETLKLVEAARARGVDVTIDQYPYTASSTGIAALLPRGRWKADRALMVERLAAPGTARPHQSRGRPEHQDRSRRGRSRKNVGIVTCGFDRFARRQEPGGHHARPWRRSRLSKTPPKRPSDLVSKGGCSGRLPRHLRRGRGAHHAVAFRDDRSDGEIPVFGQQSPHPRSYGTFARVLGVYVREQQVISLEGQSGKCRASPPNG